MKSTGWTWQTWEECALCGRDYPTSLMTTQRGLRVCTFLPCADDPDPAAESTDGRITFGEPMEVADERR